MIKKSIPELVRLLNDYTEKYNAGHPEISDADWDAMYFELLQDEKEAGYALPDSPTQKITDRIVSSLKKVTHNHKMLSLDKTKDLDEVAAFLGKEHSYLAMCKMDGLTCSLTYRGGRLVAAETRGNGVEGEDILHNAQIIRTIPCHINYDRELVVDGEIISTYENFEKFNSQFKNPRNFAAGSIRLLDSFECEKRNLRFIAWDVIKGLDKHISHLRPDTSGLTEKDYFEVRDNKKLSEKLYDLQKLGFVTVPFVVGKGGENLNKNIEDLKNLAQKCSYPIDGLVFKFNEIEYGALLGETAHHFKNAIAYKFYDEVYDTVLRNIEWSMGRTGVVTPIAIFDPVDCDGAEVSRASLHNLSVMYDLLGTPFKGQKIQIYKSNMIIPQIYSAEKPDIDETKDVINIPEVCPDCGLPLSVKDNDGVKILYCINEDCPGRTLNHLIHFCSKKGLDIKGLSEATLDKLMDWGWVKTPKDLFTLYEHAKDWYKQDGFGIKSVDKILSAIEKAKNCSLTQFISALGIPLIGQSVAKLIVKEFPTWGQFMAAVDAKYDFCQIPTLGLIKSQFILSFDYTEAKEIAEKYLYLGAKGIKEIKQNVPKTLDGLVFCITGKLHNFHNRDELKTLIEDAGGRVVDSMSSKVNYLINNDITSTSGKNKKAKELNIPIISEEDFLIKLDNDLF